MEYQNDFLTNFSFSELGCTLSHIKAIRTAYDNGDQVALICEDDISFEMSKLWPSGLFRKLIQDMNTATGIIQLCWNSSMRSDTNNKYCAYGDSYGVTPLPSDVWCWSAVAYLISRKGMHDVLAHSEYLIGTKVHLKKTPQIQDGYADKYIYKTTTVATSTFPVVVPLNFKNVTTSTQFDRNNSNNPDSVDKESIELYINIVKNLFCKGIVRQLSYQKSHDSMVA